MRQVKRDIGNSFMKHGDVLYEYLEILTFLLKDKQN